MGCVCESEIFIDYLRKCKFGLQQGPHLSYRHFIGYMVRMSQEMQVKTDTFERGTRRWQAVRRLSADIVRWDGCRLWTRMGIMAEWSMERQDSPRAGAF